MILRCFEFGRPIDDRMGSIPRKEHSFFSSSKIATTGILINLFTLRFGGETKKVVDHESIHFASIPLY